MSGRQAEGVAADSSPSAASEQQSQRRRVELAIKKLDLLTERECSRVRADVHHLRPFWIQRDARFPYYTLGAASYRDALDRNTKTYYNLAAAENPLLRRSFHWLYERLAAVLSAELVAPVVYASRFALPGFHVFLAMAGFEQAVTTVHRDLQYKLLDWDFPDDLDLQTPISFTLAISLPEAGGGLNVWDLHPWDVFCTPQHQLRDLISGSNRTYVPYENGRLVLQRGDPFHQIAATATPQPGDERITLQGHGIRCRGVWHLYW